LKIELGKLKNTGRVLEQVFQHSSFPLYLTFRRTSLRQECLFGGRRNRHRRAVERGP